MTNSDLDFHALRALLCRHGSINIVLPSVREVLLGIANVKIYIEVLIL